EEIFLKVKDMDKAIEFYHDILGIPLDKQDGERTYLQTERGHLVLQIENHTGRHQGGGPLHFAMTVTEEVFDQLLEKFEGSRYFTRGPYGERGKGRALFMIDPDGNEAEVNTRYLYGIPKRT
ncbi:MAG: VOC family protein, partial [Alphaproteobacteria bacterium]|nr:VOC family protein [Alphaproteobacteria bacterium]